MATLSKNALSSIRPALRTSRDRPRVAAAQAARADVGLRRRLRRLRRRQAPPRPLDPREGDRRGPPPRRGVRLDRAARARPRSRSPAIAETFGLHELAVEDAVTAHQRPKLERYDDTLFMVLKTVTYVGHDEPTTATEIVETGEVMVFVGPDFVVTVRHGDHCGLHDVRAQAGGRPRAARARARPPCCTRSPTTSSTSTSPSPTRSRRTSTRSRPRCSARDRRWTPSRSTS